MKYNRLIYELENYAEAFAGSSTEELLLRAAAAIEELQSTIVIVEVKENRDA